MSKNEYIRQIGFDQIKEVKEMEYISNEIAVHTNLNELPIENGSMQVDMIVIVVCFKGKIQVEMNTVPHTLCQKEALVCLPNIILDNCMMTPDFKGVVFCISLKGILEHNSENEIWDKAFYFADNPIVHVSDSSLHILSMFGSILMKKLVMERGPYFNDIIISIVKAALCELISNVNAKPLQTENKQIKQRDILFRKYMKLLSSTRIKPRNLSWYAEQLCVTPKYLSTTCKQVSGKTAYDWINEYILVDVRYWLKNTNKSIKEISNILMFPNISFFGKYCRTHLGVSPTKYRKQLRENPGQGETA